MPEFLAIVVIMSNMPDKQNKAGESYFDFNNLFLGTIMQMMDTYYPVCLYTYMWLAKKYPSAG